MALLETDDLIPFATIDDAKAEAMVADAIAMASMTAPCLADTTTLSDIQIAASKAILRAAVLRWNESGGSGGLASETAGPFSISLDTRNLRRPLFWPSEITALQKICKGGSDGGAFNIDTAAPSPMLFHSVLCSSSSTGWCNCGALAFDSDDDIWPFR